MIHGNNTVSKVRYFADHTSFVRLLVKQRPAMADTMSARYKSSSRMDAEQDEEEELEDQPGNAKAAHRHGGSHVARADAVDGAAEAAATAKSKKAAKDAKPAAKDTKPDAKAAGKDAKPDAKAAGKDAKGAKAAPAKGGKEAAPTKDSSAVKKQT